MILIISGLAVLHYVEEIYFYAPQGRKPNLYNNIDGERYGGMIGDVLKTCECIAVTVKCLDGKILNYVKSHFVNLIYIKSAEDRKLKIFSLNLAGKIWSICFFLQLKFQSFLVILETFEKTVFFDSF